MAALGKILFQIAKNMAVSRLTKKDENGSSPAMIAAGLVIGIIFLIAAFLQYVVENPIDALRAYFSDEDIVKIEQFQRSELNNDMGTYPVFPPLMDESLILPFGTDSVLADRLIREAYRHIGKPYVWAAFGPDRFDCSGYVAYCLRNSGVQQVPARPTCRSLWSDNVVPVKKGDEKPGDLIFFYGTQPTVGGATHIGIYLGNNKFIEANSDYGVKVSGSAAAWAVKHFYGFGRPKALVNAAKKEDVTPSSDKSKENKEKTKNIQVKDNKDSKKKKTGNKKGKKKK